MKHCLYFALVPFLFALSCVPPTDNASTEVSMKIFSPLRQNIIKNQDRQNTDSLILLFNHISPDVRYNAVMSMASIQDKKAVDSLISRLKDPILEVRAAAAFALGQIGDRKAEAALISAFSAKDTINIDNDFNQNILEALGKISGKKVAQMIASVNTYRASDVKLLTGQMRALYRFGLRNIITTEGTFTSINHLLASDYPKEVRELAANYLARFDDVSIATSSAQLMDVLEKDENPYIRMALATALGKEANIAIAPRFRNHLFKEKDYRVKCNLLRYLGNFGYIENAGPAMKFFKDKNSQIASCASEFFLKHGTAEDIPQYLNLLSDTTVYWNARATMYAAMLKATPLYYTKQKQFIKGEIIKELNRTPNDYEKAALIRALGQDPYQYETLINMYATVKSSVAKVAVIEALGTLMNHEEFQKAYGENQFRIKYVIVQFLKNLCKSTGDVGVVASTASLLKENKNIPKELIIDSTWINITLSKLKMPRDIEAHHELKSLEAYLNGQSYTKSLLFNHDINFNELTDLKDSSEVLIKTNKGSIKIILFLNKAPGSVANFISLSNSDFYDGKIFHRVVPNFVVQTGCPRGDGYGSQDFTIRSEFSNMYYNSEGFVGMASAGPHTEGTQFFITHSPTPHLDGKYTIIGKVTSGMDVVHNLEIGDHIIDIVITKK